MVEIIIKDALSALKNIPDESIHMCVTSPPYWGMRAYNGGEGMIGMEETWEEHLENLVEIFNEVKRALRHDGCFWLNYGDAYTGSGKGEGREKFNFNRGNPHSAEGIANVTIRDLPGKNLMFLPEQLAMRLQDEGWYVRSNITWYKNNGMAESTKDRPTKSSEKIFLLSKSRKYYFDKYIIQGSTSKNIRDVWIINNQNLSNSHHAAFPEELVYNCIMTGSSDYGCCEICKTPWIKDNEGKWTPDCECGKDANTIPCTILDPFAGSGTTGVVAAKHNRFAILIEISAEYAELAFKRINNNNFSDIFL